MKTSDENNALAGQHEFLSKMYENNSILQQYMNSPWAPWLMKTKLYVCVLDLEDAILRFGHYEAHLKKLLKDHQWPYFP